MLPMGPIRRLLLIVICSFISCGCHGNKRGLNLADLLANNNDNKGNSNVNGNANSNAQSFTLPDDITVTASKTQQFTDLSSILSAIKSGGGTQTANPNIAALLAAQKAENTNNAENANNVDNTKTSNQNEISAANLAGLLGNQGQQAQKQELSSLFSGKPTESSNSNDNTDEIKVPVGDAQMDIKDEGSGKRHTHFTLQRGADGSLMLLPITEEKGDSRGIALGGVDLSPKNGLSVTGSNRQQLQLTTLAQALYSPFPGDQNILHLHLKGKDGKNGKTGPKGGYGPPGAPGPAGPKGPKGEQGSCLAQVKKEPYGCTPDELDSLSSRVDYLEKICKKTAPRPEKPPTTGKKGGEGNPVPSCQAIYEKNPNAKSGAYWLMVNGVRFKTWCEFIKGGGDGEETRPSLAGGWTLVARIKGQANDWSPVSENWASNNTLNENTAYDMSVTSSMKNLGYSLVKSNVLLLCFTGRNTGCAPFTHGRKMPLANLFATQFGVVPDEQYTFATLMKAFGKSCDLSILRQSWCGLNLANVCDPKNADPNEKPVKTTHIARIGCVGDRTATCFPDDYAVGIGTTSCKDGFGCSNVGPSRNMHYRCDYVYGAFSQTAYLYVL